MTYKFAFYTKVILLPCYLILCVSAYDYKVTLDNDGPVVIGANITFTANLYDNSDEKPNGKFKYKWRDNAIPQNHAEFTDENVSRWTVAYPLDKYEPGQYLVQVDVYIFQYVIDWILCSERSSFNLTSQLNGKIVLKQNNTVISTEYVSNLTEVVHHINLSFPDAEYLKNNASSVITYWFLNCVYIANTSDLQFYYNYTKADVSHSLDAFTVASHVPVVNNSAIAPLNKTNSTSDISTEIYIFSTTKPIDIKSNNIVESSNSTKFSYLTVNNNTTVPELPFNCSSKTVNTHNKHYSYGLFSRDIKIKAPVRNVETEGNVWLQQGDILNLQIWCNGSAPFKYCIKFWNGIYNVTGNETCMYERMSANCDFQVTHYFSNSTDYTVLLIIRNDINKVITPIGINIYEVTKHAQLSVIIVPISASIVAVVLIVFGIAFYVQSRNRYIVEVADFDFSNAGDMKYKTFRERLVDAVSNAINKTEDYSEQDSYNGVPTNKKYGSMQ